MGSEEDGVGVTAVSRTEVSAARVGWLTCWAQPPHAEGKKVRGSIILILCVYGISDNILIS